MDSICIFKRIEKKYRLTDGQRQALLERIGPCLIPDAHGRSTVCSLYLDTPDHRLIRNSIDARVYKEKLRLRSYGTPGAGSEVFLELKKKYRGVVYKRRVSMTLAEAEAYLGGGAMPQESQIMAEIDYAMRYYRRPVQAMLIAYEREAYDVREYPALRLTFDSAIRYREDALQLERGSAGRPVIPLGTTLMEIKTDGAIPVWLSHALDELGIAPASFSKYGAAYALARAAVNRNKEVTGDDIAV